MWARKLDVAWNGGVAAFESFDKNLNVCLWKKLAIPGKCGLYDFYHHLVGVQVRQKFPSIIGGVMVFAFSETKLLEFWGYSLDIHVNTLLTYSSRSLGKCIKLMNPFLSLSFQYSDLSFQSGPLLQTSVLIALCSVALVLVVLISGLVVWKWV